jgi:hypothetical protein
MQKANYTYSNQDPAELRSLWSACLKPGGKVKVLNPNGNGNGNGKSKVPGDWVVLDWAISNGESFFVELPKHLIAIDLDAPMPENGIGQGVIQYLHDQGIYFILSTSGSNGWTLVINLWTTLNKDEQNLDYLIQGFSRKIKAIKDDLERRFPNNDWNSRVRASIRPPLSPYPFSGNLKLISPTTVSGATKILNYGGIVIDHIKPHTDSLASALALKSTKTTRAAHFMTLANVMIQAGYHYEDFKSVLLNRHTPIGVVYQDRVHEYKRDSRYVENDLVTTWEKSYKYVQENPPIGDARRLLPEWVLTSIDTIVGSDLPTTTKTRLIACVISIANIASRACTLDPVIAESRLTKLSGVSNRSISRYKKILQELGILTISFADAPGMSPQYGSWFSIKISTTSITDINSLLIITRGNRDITSVKRVNEPHIKQQINHLINTWHSHSLWLSEASGRVNGHVMWSFMVAFPHLTLKNFSELFGWSNRKTREVAQRLQVSTLAYWDLKNKSWVTYEEQDHWDYLVNVG